MKNRQSFLTAFLMGTIMIVWYNVSLPLTDNPTGMMDDDRVSLVLLQAVIIIKFFSTSVVVMPLEVNVKQLVAGYIAADLLFCLPFFWNKSLFSFSAEMVFAQAVLSVICLVSERRTSARPSLVVSEWNLTGDLIIQGL